MSLRAFRSLRAPLAYVTLCFFWNSTLAASFAMAQQAPEQESSQSDTTGRANGTYDEASRKALDGSLADRTAPKDEQGEQAPAAPQDVDRALAALPSGGAEISPQAAALPSGAATQLGMGESFTMQLSTGTLGYSVPLLLPSARGTVQPRLELSYSAGGGFGNAGLGWSLGGSAVTRQTDRGTPGYDDRASWHPNQDRFAFGGMELVPICTVSGTTCSGAMVGEVMPAWASGWQYFRPRTEGAFLRFFWSPNHQTWRVQGKDGSSMELGIPLDGTGDTSALEYNPDATSEIYRWYVAREYDSHGSPNAAAGPSPVNTVVYRYMRDGNAVYLSDIFDTSQAANPTSTNLARWAHHTALSYEVRPDVAVSYRAGFRIEHALRVARVDVASKTMTGAITTARQLVRRYHLAYVPGVHRSLLESVAMEGRCSSAIVEDAAQVLPPSNCPRMPPMRFEYESVDGDPQLLRDAQGNAYDAFDSTIQALPSSPPYSLDAPRTDLTDIDADGLPDVLVTSPGDFRGAHGVFFNGRATGSQLGFGPASRMTVQPAAGVTDANVLSLDNPVVSALDLDADGTVNLVHMPQAKRYSVFSPEPTSPGAKTYRWAGRAITTASQQDPKIDFTHDARNVRVMDVDGDGLVDVVYSSATELQTFFSLGRYPGGDGQFGHASWTSAQTAQLSNDPVTACIPWSSTPVRFSDPDTRLADMNGDGLSDIVRVRSGRVSYWPGRGNGFWGTGDRADCSSGFAENRQIDMSNAPTFGTTQPGTLLLNDVNGDGLSDVVEVRNQAVDVYLNDNGMGWTARHILFDTPFRPNDSNYVRLTDIDGSGTPDILWGRAYDYQYIDLTGGKTPGLLNKVHNGLGKTVEFEYASTSSLMLQAAAAGKPWTSVAPVTMPVLVRTTTRDNLERLGRAAGVYSVEYSYRDPVYEGRQREFRGFREALVRTPGDANSPSSSQRTVFQLGECPTNYVGGAGDVCAPTERWQENWREPIKGLPVVNEVFDDQGVYLTTEHTSYELRQLYEGLDGRGVTLSVPVGKDTFLYDTTNFDRTTSSITLPEVDVRRFDLTVLENRSLTVRASAGTARVRSTTAYDNYGNTTDVVSYGCVSGCPNGVDEAITIHNDFALPAGDLSGWLWRQTHTYTSGSINTARRAEEYRTYNAVGDVEESYAVLSGTLALDRFHATGATIAPSPANQSGGTAAAVQILTVDYSYDTYGHATFTRGANQRCAATDFDATYAHLSVAARAYAGALNTTTGCGGTVYSQSVVHDRGLEAVVDSTDPRGQPSRYAFDGLGRLTTVTRVDPARPGQLATLPAMTIQYNLPADAVATPYTVTVVRAQDGADSNTNSYAETWTYKDGIGRTIADLTPADRAAGDTGDWVAQGDVFYDAKGAPARAHDSWFYTGAPGTFPLSGSTTTPYKSREYDAFGRNVRAYDYDHQITVATEAHALSSDIYDRGDILSTLHRNTHVTSISDGHGRGVQRIERVKVGAQLELRYLLAEYLPTGEVVRLTQRRTGSPDVVRWRRYDSLGRLVLNAEPNTTVGFNPNPNTAPSSLKAWRYAYDDAGDMVGASDARGCGVNYHYDTGGRMLAEDRSPCLAQHAAYSTPNLTTGDGTEAFYRYDAADPDLAAIQATNSGFTQDTTVLHGRLVSISGLGAKAVYRYDAAGRTGGVAVQVQKPGVASTTLSARFAPRWYVKTQTLDAADRVTRASTGATTPELLGGDGTSELRLTYTKRSLLARADSSYGTLMARSTYFADGRLQQFTLGDAAATQRYISYDTLHRPSDIQTYRGNLSLWSTPTASYTPPSGLDDPGIQLLLEDIGLGYDEVGNITSISDNRIDSDWPATAKPATRTFEYDDLNRLTRVAYSFATPTPDTWRSPFARENADSTLTQPAPHVSFTSRPTEQRFTYDYLGNISQTTDDQSGFWDRSTGNRVHGSASVGPNQIASASNRTLAPSSTRKGDLSVGYDPAGNTTGLIVRRDGTCLPAGASCWQRFAYEFDEVGQLSRARRWDLTTAERTSNGQLTQALPARVADVEMLFGYDATGVRVLKTAIDRNLVSRHTVYAFDTLEVRTSTWSGTDYGMLPQNVFVRLATGNVSARVVYSTTNMPATSTSRQHVFLEMGDNIGSTSFLIDKTTSELVEYRSYQAYGATEADYRPNRWQGYREPYGFTGKEEDIEVGLAYFGARFFSPYLTAWLSPDPVTIHDIAGDLNPYAYVRGTPLMGTDPDGKFPIIDDIVDAVGGAIGGAVDFVVGAAQGAVNAIGNAVHAFANDVLAPLARAGIAMLGQIGSMAGAVANFAARTLNYVANTAIGLVNQVARAAYAMASASWHAVSSAARFAWDNIGRPIVRGVRNAAVWLYEHRERIGEALLTGAAGFALGFLVAGPIGGFIGGINGLVQGYNQTYNWADGSGFAAFAADSTWGLVGTGLGEIWNVVQLCAGADYNADLSRRQNRMVWENGFSFAKGSGGATTMGNVIATKGQFSGKDDPLLVHETLHITQSRGFGPLYQGVYVAWAVGGAVVSLGYWGVCSITCSNKPNLFDTIYTISYLDNPWELWAYTKGGDDTAPEPRVAF